MATQCRHVFVQVALTCDQCGHDWDIPSHMISYEQVAPTVAEVANHVSSSILEEECPNCKWNGGR